MSDLDIEVHGIKELNAAFRKFPTKVAKNMTQAGHEASTRDILPTKGLQRYPPATAANQPPTPYYVRGTGTQLKSRNLMNSENLGKQWTTRQEGWTTRIGNRASYAKWVHGEEQAKAMGAKGWRKLLEVAKEKIGKVTKVYSDWVAKTLKECGLR